MEMTKSFRQGKISVLQAQSQRVLPGSQESPNLAGLDRDS
jgi:hypothetical protein